MAAVLFAGNIIGAFTDDPTVTQYTQSYIWIVGMSYGFLAAGMVEASAFQAIGRSWPGLWIFLIKFAGVAIPLSYALTHVLGVSIAGVWVAIAAGNVVSSSVGYFWIRHAMNKIKPREARVHHATA